jgi:GTPase SAR1 family protein
MCDFKIFNVGVFGDKESGKTSLIRRIVSGKFPTKKIVAFNNPEVKQINNMQLNFYDIADEKNNDNGKIIFDTTILILNLLSIASYRNILGWFDCLIKNNKAKNIILVGTKCDFTEMRQIDYGTIIRLCENYKFCSIKYIEVSSKVGTNISSLLEVIIFNCVVINKSQPQIIFDQKINSYSTFDKEESEIIKLLPDKKKSKLQAIIDKIFYCIKDRSLS